VHLAVIAILLFACSSPGKTVSAPAFGAAVSGLACALELPASARAGEAVTARLHFRNASSARLRIYMLEPEVFRSFQSSLFIRDATGKVVGVPPVSPPHGYLPRESDFPVIAPGETKTFTQALALDDAALAGGGSFTVEWTYSNTITEWKGGAQTLDGPTKPLFGGGPIPYIWSGKIVASATLVVEPRRN
jgi:hypothetical protein